MKNKKNIFKPGDQIFYVSPEHKPEIYSGEIIKKHHTGEKNWVITCNDMFCVDEEHLCKTEYEAKKMVESYIKKQYKIINDDFKRKKKETREEAKKSRSNLKKFFEELPKTQEKRNLVKKVNLHSLAIYLSGEFPREPFDKMVLLDAIPSGNFGKPRAQLERIIDSKDFYHIWINTVKRHFPDRLVEVIHELNIPEDVLKDLIPE